MNTVEQRKIVGKFAVIIIAVLLVLLCYSYFLPRTEVEIDTVYHSSYSGLFVQSKVSNSGTKEITDLKVKLGVWNSTELLESEIHYPGTLSPKQSVKLPVLIFDGPHADSYELVIKNITTEVIKNLFETQRYSFQIHYRLQDTLRLLSGRL